MKPTFSSNSLLAFTSTSQLPARSRRTLARGVALPALVALGALGCSVRVAGDAKNGGEAAGAAHSSSASTSSSTSDARASAKAEGRTSARSNADAQGSGGARISAKAEGSSKGGSNADAKGSGDAHASAKLKAPASAESKLHASASDNARIRASSKVSIDTKTSSKVSVDTKRAVFQTKPRVSAVGRAKATPVFVGIHGSGSLQASGTAKVKGSTQGKDDKDKPSKESAKPEVTENEKPIPAKEKPEKDAEKKPGKDPATKVPEKESAKKPAPAVTKKPAPAATKKPTEAAPKLPEPVPAPIEPPAEPPENVFGYDAPVRGCFEGLVYFIPENSQALPKSYEGLTSSAALYACEWDIPTRAWEQGFPGLEDRFEWFAIRYSGAFNVTQAGSWTFRISSDDGTRLYIDDKLVIDNDGVHSPKERTGKVNLTAGDHTMVLEYFQGPRYHINLQLFATPPGGSEGVFSVR